MDGMKIKAVLIVGLSLLINTAQPGVDAEKALYFIGGVAVGVGVMHMMHQRTTRPPRTDDEKADAFANHVGGALSLLFGELEK